MDKPRKPLKPPQRLAEIAKLSVKLRSNFSSLKGRKQFSPEVLYAIPGLVLNRIYKLAKGKQK